jgi:hypothetical protein
MADVKAVDLLVLDKKDPEAGEKYNKNGFVIRVVKWVYKKKDGSEGESIRLEKRENYLTEDGEVRSGKAKGFTYEDLHQIKAKWTLIMGAFEKALRKPEPAAEREPVEEEAY